MKSKRQTEWHKLESMDVDAYNEYIRSLNEEERQAVSKALKRESAILFVQAGLKGALFAATVVIVYEVSKHMTDKLFFKEE